MFQNSRCVYLACTIYMLIQFMLIHIFQMVKLPPQEIDGLLRKLPEITDKRLMTGRAGEECCFKWTHCVNMCDTLLHFVPEHCAWCYCELRLTALETHLSACVGMRTELYDLSLQRMRLHEPLRTWNATSIMRVAYYWRNPYYFT